MEKNPYYDFRNFLTKSSVICQGLVGNIFILFNSDPNDLAAQMTEIKKTGHVFPYSLISDMESMAVFYKTDSVMCPHDGTPFKGVEGYNQEEKCCPVCGSNDSNGYHVFIKREAITQKQDTWEPAIGKSKTIGPFAEEDYVT